MFLRPQLHSALMWQWLGCQFKPERSDRAPLLNPSATAEFDAPNKVTVLLAPDSHGEHLNGTRWVREDDHWRLTSTPSAPPPLTYSGEHDMLVAPDVEAQARHLRERKVAE